MKNVEKYLNSLQLAHLKDPTKCSGNKCKFKDCVNCLCDMRSDSKYCCPQHRSAAGNILFKARHSHINDYASAHRHNTLIIENLYRRGKMRFNEEYLNAAEFDFSYIAPKLMINSHEVSHYGNIGMWLDSEGFFNLLKIE